MTHVSIPTDAQAADIQRIAEKLMVAIVREDATNAAMAAARVAVTLWALGGATQEQAKAVMNKLIDVSIEKHDN